MEGRNYSMGSVSNPNFFKPIIPEMTSERLRIPSKFMKHITHENSQTFFLTGPSSNIWIVGLIQYPDDYFFEEGWPKFVADNDLKLGDICVFVYEGNLNFTVKILDQSECEKESTLHTTCSQDCMSYADKGKNLSSTYESRQSCSKRKINMLANLTESNVRSGSIKSQRRNVTAEEKLKAIEAANAFKSNNPFMMIVMRPSYVYHGFYLPIPSAFMKSSHLPEANQDMILTDPTGKAWPVGYVVTSGTHSKASRGALSAGWQAFSYGNNLEEDDVCIFELIEQDEVQVHIFRVAEEITPLIKHSKRCGNS